MTSLRLEFFSIRSFLRSLFRASTVLVVGAFLLFSTFLLPTSADLERDAELKGQLDQLTKEIDGLRNVLRTTRTQQQSLSQEVKQLEQEIRRTELSLQRSERILAQTAEAVKKIEEEIAIYEARVQKTHDVIAALLRTIAERDALPPAAWIFAGKNFSDFADQLAAGSQMQEQLLIQIQGLRDLEGELAQKKAALEEQRLAEEEARQLLVAERDDLAIKRQLRAQVLVETRGREQEFAKRLTADEQNAARIRTQLYLLADLGRSLQFGEAYRIAKPIGDSVGIRPAFLLAVLQKESRLGALVGSGYWRTDMHPRDWSAFLQITKELGLDAEKVPVSRKPSYGWGGAMGPAQFLPSVWMGYRERIIALTGNNPPSPWNVQDAFAAAGIKLAAAGANAKNEDAEWRAAMIYFAGGNWRNPSYAFYGDAVEDLAAAFQQQINILEQAQ